MIRANEKIRQAIEKSGLRYWQIADKLGITDGNFSRLLRKELPEEKQSEIYNIISELKGNV